MCQSCIDVGVGDVGVGVDIDECWLCIGVDVVVVVGEL